MNPFGQNRRQMDFRTIIVMRTAASFAQSFHAAQRMVQYTHNVFQ